MDFLTEAVVDTNEQKTKVVVAIGRFQPPHIGHYKVISKMKEFIRTNKHLGLDTIPVIVIVDGKNTSKNLKENPLSVDDRINFIKSSGHANGVRILVADNLFSAFEVVRKNGYEPIAIAAGTDRAKTYKKLLDEKFLSKDEKPIEHFIVPGLDRNKVGIVTKKKEKIDGAENVINSGSNDVADVSASIVRHAAEMGFFEEFLEMTGLKKKERLGKIMYDKVRKSLGVA